MEKTESSHPRRVGARWAEFLAPVAVTGVVIAGASTVAVTSFREAVEDPIVRRSSLDADHNDGPPSLLTAVGEHPTAARHAQPPEEQPPARINAPRHRDHQPIPPPPASNSIGSAIDSSEDDEDRPIEYERVENKRELAKVLSRSPIFGPSFRRVSDERQADVHSEPAEPNESPAARPGELDPQLGAAGAGPQ